MKMKKRLLSILLSLVMVLGLLPGMMTAAYAENYPLTVGGVQVTDANASNITGGSITSGNASYDAQSNTLTLNGVTINGGEYGINYYKENRTLNIVLVGENTITNTERESINTYEIASVSLSGVGSLNAIKGILIRDNVTIDGCTVSSTQIRGLGSITILSGNVTVENTTPGYEALRCDSGSITISGGTVTVIGTKGIVALKLSITGGTVNVTSAGSNSTGIIVDRPGVSITGGTVTVSYTGSNSTGISSDYGNGNVSITGGTVTVSGTSKAINGKVKNSFGGTGWDNVEGTGDGTAIDKNKDPGQTLAYKKVYFEVTPYPLWVGGKQVTDGNEDDVFGDSKVSFTPAEGSTPATLTLNGFKYEGEGYKPAVAHFGILYGEEGVLNPPLKIKLQGENTLTCTGNESGDYDGIWSYEDLTFDGTGSLSVNAKTYGIINTFQKDISILGGSLTVKGATGIGIGGKKIEIGENAGTVTVEGRGFGSIIADAGLYVNSGTVTVTNTGTYGSSVKGNVTIGEKVSSFIATGTDEGQAVNGTITNAIAGTGWTNTAGTEGQADIEVSDGQVLSSYKKVQFPAEIKPAEVVTAAPAAAPAAAPTAAPTHVPKTGDGANLVLWIGLILLGFLGIIAFAGMAGRKHRNR